MKQNIDTKENIPLRVLTIPECQNLICKILLAVYIVIESALSINRKVFNFDKLLNHKTKDKNEIEFSDFKPIVMSMFGNNLFSLSSVDIDSILRKVHRELIVMASSENVARDQNISKRHIAKVTD